MTRIIPLLRAHKSPLVDDEPTEEQRELTATISCADHEMTDLTQQLVCCPRLTDDQERAIHDLNAKIVAFQLLASSLVQQPLASESSQ